MAKRPDPDPCRPQDLGLFEIVSRDGAARIGKFHTNHGILTTPMLLPVVNPNLRTIEPREMWERYGVDALITNSYVIWKHEKLRSPALEKGIHELLDFPGIVVTDSGTFQSYVYGDVEVGVEEIVSFQREIGVDIGTMLDVFGRPDMGREELESAVSETSLRAVPSLEEAGEQLLLNGPIQGGLHHDLRAEAGGLMGLAESEHRGFAVHPIGGIVPLMEKQRYRELFGIILASRSTIPRNRPIHMFGCGHPLLFPLSIALGVDLFDSAAYALFARDGRLLTPEGTVKLEGLQEWPTNSSALFGKTPAQVREMERDERTALLSHHNLEVTQAELARCREAVRNGTIWELAEKRSHSSPRLREAFLWVIDELEELEENEAGNALLDLMASTNPVRGGGEPISEDIDSRPHILHMMALISLRWRLPGSWWDGSSGPPDRVVVLEGKPPPWRNTCLHAAVEALIEVPKSVVVISTPVGVIPFSFEDVSPFCHIDGPEAIWLDSTDDEQLNEDLETLGLGGIPYVISKPGEIPETPPDGAMDVRLWMDRCSVVDKLSVLCAIRPSELCEVTENMESRRSKTDRIINVSVDDEHLLSPRLTDGGISLAIGGARKLHSINPEPPLRFDSSEAIPEADHPGMPRVLLSEDAIPFVGKGRNVMHGYIEGADPHIIPGQPCIVVSSSGELVAHGVAQSTALEMSLFRKGIAVKIRDGALKED
jgi:7-cyano-7-deazaguanine tRNA-ribosyltransferase